MLDMLLQIVRTGSTPTRSDLQRSSLANVVENSFVKKLAVFSGAWRQEQVELSERTMFDFVDARKLWQTLFADK